MRVLITGSSGTVGEILGNIAADITPFDQPDHDSRDLADFTESLRGQDALVHLAWDVQSEYCGLTRHSESINPDNTLMFVNAYKAAKAAGVSRVVMASSVHAAGFDKPQTGLISADTLSLPHCPYGANKQLMENLGRSYTRDLGVVCLRFGAMRSVNDANRLGADERNLWLSHEDSVSVVNSALTAKLVGNFALSNAVSDNAGRIHSLVNSIGWQPA